eukprot:gene22130-1294_t
MKLGSLSMDEKEGQATLKIGNTELSGTILPLKKPLVLLKGVVENTPEGLEAITYKIGGIVKRKFHFNSKPRQIPKIRKYMCLGGNGVVVTMGAFRLRKPPFTPFLFRDHVTLYITVPEIDVQIYNLGMLQNEYQFPPNAGKRVFHPVMHEQPVFPLPSMPDMARRDNKVCPFLPYSAGTKTCSPPTCWDKSDLQNDSFDYKMRRVWKFQQPKMDVCGEWAGEWGGGGRRFQTQFKRMFPDKMKREIPLQMQFHNVAVEFVPHHLKEETGGEDAYFVSRRGIALGVADGVGGWAKEGVDSSRYSRMLMKQCCDFFDQGDPSDA